MELPTALLSPSSKKFFSHFRKWNFLAPRLKKFIYLCKWYFLILQEGTFRARKIKRTHFYAQAWKIMIKKSALKKFLIFLKKAFLTFQERELSNIFLKKFFLFFWKWNFLALRMKISGRNFRARKIKKTLTKFLIWGNGTF